MPEYTYRTVPNENQEKVYRCKVVGDNTATLLVGRKTLKVFVRETFGSGFTLGIDPKLTKRIHAGKRYELRYDDRRIEVIAESFSETVQGEARLRVGTIREFEPVKRWAFRLPFTRGSRVISHESSINGGAAYGGFVLVLFCIMSLPGIGDKLGTAPRIESALQMVGKNVGEVVRTFRS